MYTYSVYTPFEHRSWIFNCESTRRRFQQGLQTFIVYSNGKITPNFLLNPLRSQNSWRKESLLQPINLSKKIIKILHLRWICLCCLWKRWNKAFVTSFDIDTHIIVVHITSKWDCCNWKQDDNCSLCPQDDCHSTVLLQYLPWSQSPLYTGWGTAIFVSNTKCAMEIFCTFDL